MNIRLESEQACIDLGKKLAGAIERTLPSPMTVYLEGDLGVGKTTLVRALIRALGYDGAVKSPTYTLLEPYSIGALRIYHLDLYRISDAEELEYLGIRDFAGAADSLLLIEWPEKGMTRLPKADLTILLSYAEASRQSSVADPEQRDCSLNANSPSGAAVLAQLSGSNLNSL